MGAKIVLARPASRVSPVSAVTRRGPHHRVSAAKAGGYSTPAIATPARIHAPKYQGSVGADAIPITAGAPRTEPVVMTGRGPNRSSHRPAGMPASAATTRPV